MMSSPNKTVRLALVLALGAWIAACDECETSRDCGTGQACIDGTCESAEPWNPSTDSDTDVDTDVDSDTDSDTDTDTDDPYALVWVEIEGGTYPMGYALGEDDELPVHDVTVPTFQMTQSAIMVIQYAHCVSDGTCAEPASGARFNWGVEGRFTHPINGVRWVDADNFCAWVGGRLPSEAEWEYAARSGGQDLIYPWGSEIPSCERCIMNDALTGPGCDENHTWPVCSTPSGDTEHGLCDMSGNVDEWMADYYYNTYAGAPDDGSAWDVPPYEEYAERTIRGGSYQSTVEVIALRTSGRQFLTETYSEDHLGFRCARAPQ